MPIPIIAGIGAVLVSILSVIASVRKVVAFVISGVVFSLFVWLMGRVFLKGYQIRDRVLEVGEKANQSFIPQFFDLLDKIAYVFPIYEAFFALSFYLIFCGTCLFLHWILQFWNMIPFKDSAGS